MRVLLILSLTIVFVGCKKPLDKNFEIVKDKYKVGYYDNPTENHFVIHYKSDGVMAHIVHKKVKRIGYNDRFSIVERVGNYGDLDATTLDSLIVRYYIIDMTLKPNIMDSAFYFRTDNYDTFLTRKKQLGIADLNFTKEFRTD